MREIKFRAKNLFDGKWVYGYYRERIGFDKGIIDEHNGLGHDVDKKTVGMFTGLKDKNGKEIYEGDIVQDFDGEGDYCIWKERLGVVEFFEGSFFPISERHHT